MTKTGVVGHGLEASIDFVFAHNVETSLDKVVFEDAFMQLVEEVWC
jgi:hypothetical protein